MSDIPPLWLKLHLAAIHPSLGCGGIRLVPWAPAQQLISLRPSNLVCAYCPKVGWSTKTNVKSQSHICTFGGRRRRRRRRSEVVAEARQLCHSGEHGFGCRRRPGCQKLSIWNWREKLLRRPHQMWLAVAPGGSVAARPLAVPQFGCECRSPCYLWTSFVSSCGRF